ncbi:MAG: HAD family hydrolase [Hyphomonas sp.]|uniref:HAD-IIA family hydrolase n=1 Tax=Hyphomonas sp. TaxID=87 RepID=UPI0017C6E483|nr:HAD family hydrolase [Hyphomonas sp.]MBA3067758.1 HAD family hydrolase [Hyphomonas sp.]MBU3922532.1 HAD hydrolase-like protein [Alphaproteobacteria bacterium]MBU4062154.1 HAD hydrolase-like protein [Alphaproteobacteria bacterium]MBU4165589.1 HAD hydrolase-like protein [Alphaproteobacteria bacterium]
MGSVFSINAKDIAPGVIADARGFLMDWDGCCAVDNQLVPSAVRFLKANQARAVIVSNNSSNTVEDFLRILSKAGIEMRAEQIVLAGVEALNRAAEIGSPFTWVLSDPRMRFLARRLGLCIESDSPDLIVLLRDTRFTYPRLEKIINALAGGAKLIVSNPDITHPGRAGRIRPETGALLAAIRACVDLPESRLEIVGKPNSRLFQKGCSVLGQEPASLVMIGDNQATDIAGAEALGMNALLVAPAPEPFFRSLVQTVRIA